jgi:hypothetical protein
MVQKAAQKNGQRKGKRGPATAQGRQHQIASRLQHGIRSRSPALLVVESPTEWQQHLEGIRRSFDPSDEYEECLVHLIAYKIWCWIGRLIVYERDLTFAKMTAPSDSLIRGGCSSDDIQKVLSTPSADLEAQQKAAVAQQARYEALGNGESNGLVFSAPEVEELVGWFLKRIQTCDEDDKDDEDDEQDESDEERCEVDPDDHAPIFDGENRSWTGAEVQEQLALLCEAAGQDWRAKLPWVLYDRQHKLDERFSRLSEAKEQIAYNRILGLEELNRLTLYERQIHATLKHLVNQLERHQALRRGQPVAAPLALDVIHSYHGIQSDIP